MIGKVVVLAVEFKWYPLDELVEEHIDPWHRLGQNALSPNIYLMPGFVAPAARHLLNPLSQPIAATAWNSTGQLCGLALFTLKSPSLKFPFTRLVSFYSRHSFQSGVLVCKTEAQRAMFTLIEGITQQYGTIQFNEIRTDTATTRLLLSTTRQLGMAWVWEKVYQRATLADPHTALCAVSSKRHKSIQRHWSKLQQKGTVEFSVLSAPDVTETDTEAFLQLESSGWKHTSALAGDQANTQFFRAMARANNASGYLFFTQLKLNGKPIAATSNFIVGDHFFAFKTGFDPDFAKVGPGILVEYAFLQWCTSHARFVSFDSGAQAGSYIEEFWPGRSQIASGTLLRAGINKIVFDLKTCIKFARTTRPELNEGRI